VLARCAEVGSRTSGNTLALYQQNWTKYGGWSKPMTPVRRLRLASVYLEQHQSDNHLDELADRLKTACRSPDSCCAVGENGWITFLRNWTAGASAGNFRQPVKLWPPEWILPALLHVPRHADTIGPAQTPPPARGGIVHAFAAPGRSPESTSSLGFKLWPRRSRQPGLRQKGCAERWQRLPINSLVLETDSPDMAPSFHAHQRNSPRSFCHRSARKLAGQCAGEAGKCIGSGLSA